jgi:hypothetical protein
VTRRTFLASLAAVVGCARFARHESRITNPGIAIRFLRPVAAREITRLDVLYGMATVRPALAVRVVA